jgi:hypothetical protein
VCVQNCSTFRVTRLVFYVSFLIKIMPEFHDPFMYILILMFIDTRQKDKKDSSVNGSGHFSNVICSEFLH